MHAYRHIQLHAAAGSNSSGTVYVTHSQRHSNAHVHQNNDLLQFEQVFVPLCTFHCIHNKIHYDVHTVDPGRALQLDVRHSNSHVTISQHTHNVRYIASNSRSYNYIFKVLFTTPSWYLFSIGFGHVPMFW